MQDVRALARKIVFLPGTAVEAREIPRLLGGKQQHVLLGEQATESVLLVAGTPRGAAFALGRFYCAGVWRLAKDFAWTQLTRIIIRRQFGVVALSF